MELGINPVLAKPQLAKRERLYAMGFSTPACPFVCLLPKCVHENAIFSKAKQFRAMVSIDDL